MRAPIFDPITVNISRVLEALFDEIEYRSAKRALRHAAKIKAKRRSRAKVLSDEVIAASSNAISVRAT
jgi:hypothetical protein